MLQATNPTPYHVSFSSITLASGGNNYTVETSMVEPKSSAEMVVKGAPHSVSGATVDYSAINDFGGGIDGKVKL